jgi:hypothetical protein
MSRLYRFSGFGIRSRLCMTLCVTSLLMSALAGCKSEDARTASPRAAAKAYLTAMVAGDIKTISEISDGSPDSLEVLIAMAQLNAAHNRLEQASVKRFGDARSVFAYPRGRDSHPEMLKNVETAPETIEGETAKVGTGSAVVSLKRVNGQWKVNRDQHAPPSDNVDTLLAMPRALTGAYNEVADGLEAGHYETADMAKADLMGKTTQAILAQENVAAKPATRPMAELPTTAPATRPSR